MHGRETCVDCGRISPEAGGENTLTTSFGWRVRRLTDDAGNDVIEWRCASCWQRWKMQRPRPLSEAPSPTPAAPSATPAAPSAAPARIPRDGNR